MVTTISEEMSVNRLVSPSRKTVRGTAAPPVRSRTSRRRWARSRAVELETWYTRTPRTRQSLSRCTAVAANLRATWHGAATLSTRLPESGT